MIDATNSSVSRGVFLLAGPLLGLFIVLDPYISSYVELSSVGLDVPYGFSILTVICFIFASIFIILIKMILTLDIEKSFFLLYIIAFQTVALSPNSKLDCSDLVLLVYLLIFLISRSLKKNGLKVTSLDILNLCFLFTLILSIFNGGFVSIINLPTPLLAMILSFLVVNFCCNKEMLRFVIKWQIIITILSAIFGILQEAFFVVTRIPVVGFIPREELRHMFEPTSIGDVLRIPALTGSYIALAYFLGIGLIFCLCILLYWPLKGKQTMLLSVIISILFVAFLLSLSTYSLLAFICIIPIILLVRWPRYSFHIVMLFMLLIIGLFVTGYYEDFSDSVLKEITFGEFRIRLQLNREGLLGVMNRHPWIGAGMQKSARYSSHYYGWGAHNDFIRATADLGILGLAFYSLLIIYSLVKVIVINLKVQKIEDVVVARALLFSFCFILLVLQFDSTYISLHLWFSMSVIKAADLIYTKTNINQTVLQA